MTILSDSATEDDYTPRRGCVSVYLRTACLTDKASLTKLLEPIPDAELLRPKLKRKGTAHHWDPDLQIEFWVFSNARNVASLEIWGLDERQVARSRNLFAERCRSAGGHGKISWIESILREATNTPPLATH